MSMKIPIFWLVLTIISIIFGYLEHSIIGVAWALAISFTYFISYVPFAGAFIYHFVIIPWIDSFISISSTLKIIEILWIVEGYTTCALTTFAIVIAILLSR